MAISIVDTCVLSADWFKDVLAALQSKRGVVFVFTKHPKMWGEIKKNEKYIMLFKYAKDMGRLLEISEVDCAREIALIEADPIWCSCGACDDPHIFALTALARVNYVFTDDRRIGVCRAKVRTVIGRQYCNFKLIHSLPTFEKHRQRIVS